MKTTATQSKSNAFCKQLAVIDTSQQYILLIIVALLLSYYATSLQREQLVCTAAGCEWCGNVLPIRLVSSIFVIAALLFFYQLSQRNLCECRCSNSPTGCCSPTINHMANILVLAAALIRLWDLLTTQNAPAL